MHQDAHEFLNYLVNSVVENMEEEEKLLREREKTTGEKEKSNPAPTEDCACFTLFDRSTDADFFG